MNLTPTELSTLNATGSVRVVRVCEPPINFGEYEGATDKQKSFALNQTAFLRNASPFPPAGTREVIPDIGPCVWGESWCRQVKDLVTERAKQLFPNLEHEDERWADPDTYVWVGHIRKDTE